jgi:hypothetical protein
MAADKVELRDVTFRQWFPWTELFRGFQVALDPKKLLLAATGLLVMALGWWVLGLIFLTSRANPSIHLQDYPAGESDPAYVADLYKYNLLRKAAQPGYSEPGKSKLRSLNTWPWFEERGANPYLLVTGGAGRDGRASPWEEGRFWDWLIRDQIPVLIEPLVKFLSPIIYLLDQHAGFWNRIYFALVLIWSCATWALFGGAITRMAAVQLARKEKISLGEALRFTTARYLSYLSAPLIPLVFVGVVVVFLMIFGLFHLIPLFGDIVVDGLGWPLVLLAGLAMAVVLVGLVGWPMMYGTISAEGSDSFDALSRSYSYVYQSPWHYVWYGLVALAYGAVVVFFVGLMGSLTVYLGKLGMSSTGSIAGRSPDFLFVFAPTSFGWRDLLLGNSSQEELLKDMTWYNSVGAFMVSVWLYLAFLIVVGFAYSFFWCESTIVYLLMRRKVDDTELDEVYLEDDELDEAYPTAATSPAASTPAASTGSSLPIVEPPPLKTAVASTPASPAVRIETTHPKESDIGPPGPTPLS